MGDIPRGKLLDTEVYKKQLVGEKREQKIGQIDLLEAKIKHLNMPQEEKQGVLKRVGELKRLILTAIESSEQIDAQLEEQKRRIAKLSRPHPDKGMNTPKKYTSVKELQRMKKRTNKYQVKTDIGLATGDVRWIVSNISSMIYPEAHLLYPLERKVLNAVARNQIELDYPENRDGLHRFAVLELLSKITKTYDQYKKTELDKKENAIGRILNEREAEHKRVSKRLKKPEANELLSTIQQDKDILEDIIASTTYKKRKGVQQPILSGVPNTEYFVQETGRISAKTPQGMKINLHEYEFTEEIGRRDRGQDINSIRIFSTVDLKILYQMVKTKGAKLFNGNFEGIRLKYLEKGYFAVEDIMDILAEKAVGGRTNTGMENRTPYPYMVRKILYQLATRDDSEFYSDENMDALIMARKDVIGAGKKTIFMTAIGRRGHRNLGLETKENMYYTEIIGDETKGFREGDGTNAIVLSDITPRIIQDKYRVRGKNLSDPFVEKFKSAFISEVEALTSSRRKKELPYIRVKMNDGKRMITTGTIEDDIREDGRRLERIRALRPSDRPFEGR